MMATAEEPVTCSPDSELWSEEPEPKAGFDHTPKEVVLVFALTFTVDGDESAAEGGGGGASPKPKLRC